MNPGYLEPTILNLEAATAHKSLVMLPTADKWTGHPDNPSDSRTSSTNLTSCCPESLCWLR